MKRRILFPAAVAVLAMLAAFNPTVPGRQNLIDTLVVVDITRSMNVRDMGGQSRLEYARIALRDWIGSRPCGSRTGLAVFTERRSLTLFEPVEICADFSVIERSLEALDWRMAWEGDSLISRGVNHALDRAAQLGVALVFVTDGHEAPPLPYEGAARHHGGNPGGLILGAGGEALAPIPKFDDLGRETGFYEESDLQQAPARIGAPPPDAAERPGYHPRNNPYGEADLEGNEHLSQMRGSYLQALAEERGLGFLSLGAGPVAIEQALAAHAPSHREPVRHGLAPYIGAFACALLLALWLASRFSSRNPEKENI